MVPTASSRPAEGIMTTYFTVAPIIWPILLLAGLLGTGLGIALSALFNGSDRLAQDLRAQAEDLAEARRLADVLSVKANALEEDLRFHRCETDETRNKLKDVAEAFLQREHEHARRFEETPKACPSCPHGRKGSDLHKLEGVTKADLAILRGVVSVGTRAELLGKANSMAKRRAIAHQTGIALEKVNRWAKAEGRPALEVVEGGKKRKARKAA